MLNPMSVLPLTRQALHPAWVDVVSIQSQVVYGMVGNNAAVPALNKHGFITAAVPTVLLSNTPHYPSIHGDAIPVDWLRGFLDDLKQRGALERLRAVLVGYLGHPEHAVVLANWIRRLQQEIEGLLVIVDPVIGDHDVGTYVNPDLIDAYRQELLPLATGLTPNGYELEQLTEIPIHQEDDVRKAAKTLLNHRTQWVAVTSAAPGTWADDQMGITVVTAEDAVTINHPKVDCNCKGTGDLFTANLTAYILKRIDIYQFLQITDLYQAAAQAASHVLAVLEHTRAACCEELMLPSCSSLSLSGTVNLQRERLIETMVKDK